MNEKGTIIIVTLWILTILVLLAVGVGFRMGLEIKLTGFNVSELKAVCLAKAAVNKAASIRWTELLEGKVQGIDALGQPWSNDEENFSGFELGEGKFTLSFRSGERDRSDEEVILYGMEDESGRININSDKMQEPLKVLLMNKGLELEEALDIVSSIKDWRDSDNIPSKGGAEELYYQGLDKPYHAGDTDFRAVEELLLVKGMTEELFYGEDKNKDEKIDPEEAGIAECLTIFGEAEVNINTAPEPVLKALFGIGYDELAGKILNYRRGFDGKIGTSDDRWFAKGGYTVHREDLGLVAIKDLNDKSWAGNIFGISGQEWQRIHDLGGEGALITTSNIYRANVTSRVRKVRKKITAVIKFGEIKPLQAVGFAKTPPPPDIKYLWWHEG